MLNSYKLPEQLSKSTQMLCEKLDYTDASENISSHPYMYSCQPKSLRGRNELTNKKTNITNTVKRSISVNSSVEFSLSVSRSLTREMSRSESIQSVCFSNSFVHTTETTSNPMTYTIISKIMMKTTMTTESFDYHCGSNDTSRNETNQSIEFSTSKQTSDDTEDKKMMATSDHHMNIVKCEIPRNT
ncbi:unnamed protein product [Heterobilharzia americana]|nr:unnamed protein product [Heterobilharzia americana]